MILEVSYQSVAYLQTLPEDEGQTSTKWKWSFVDEISDSLGLSVVPLNRILFEKSLQKRKTTSGAENAKTKSKSF
jgi:hypothetical protein